jgi:hypothetical protein
MAGLILMLACQAFAAETAAPKRIRTPEPRPDIPVPAENQAPGTMPSLDGADVMSKAILDAIKKDDPAAAADRFFPSQPFLALKDMPGAANYHKQLVKWYEADIHREHARLKNLVKDITTIEYDRFAKGSCKWKAPGTEHNFIGYWSCYRNRMMVKDGPKSIAVDVRAMINWGSAWHVTHLGPMPKAN